MVWPSPWSGALLCVAMAISRDLSGLINITARGVNVIPQHIHLETNISHLALF